MDPPTLKRHTVKLKSPNPLFEKWLTEWRDKAKENNSKMEHTFNIALKSLKHYPIPLDSGKDCIILKGFGAKLCQMLDNKLTDYKTKRQNGDTTIDYDYIEEPPKKQPKKKTPKISPKNKSPNSKTYTPAHRSGAYAILLALLNKSQEPNYSGSMTKKEIIENARDLCDKSFTKSDPGSFYTAWSSMAALITKKFIEKKGSPAKFSLTPEGFEIALRLIDSENIAENDLDTPSTSKTNGNNSNDLDSCNKIRENNINRNLEIFNDDNPAEIIKNSIEDLGSRSKNGTNNTESQRSEEIQASNEENGESQTNVETIILAPGTFDILLLVDTQETEGSNKSPLDDETKYELNKLGILYEIRHMKVGDFTWLCRDRTTNNELVLPYVAERKRMDDLGSSIKDGRFHEQKFRLKQCGIQNLIYVIESLGNNTHTGLPMNSLMQAATNTLVQDGFQIKFTDSHRHSMQYLAGFTMILKKHYENKTLVSCPKDDLPKQSVADDLISLLTFKEFNKGGSKQKDHSVKDIFVKQILQLKGVSVEKALAIAEKYPTPRLLKQEYNTLGAKAENLLAKIEYGPQKRTIGNVISRTVYQLYTNEVLS